MRLWAVQRRKLLSKIRFWKSKSTNIDLRTRKILVLKKAPSTPFRAALSLLLTFRFDFWGWVVGRMPWENQIDNRKNKPTRQTMTDKPSSILKFMIKSLYPLFFPSIGVVYWFIDLWFSNLMYPICVNHKWYSSAPPYLNLKIFFLKYTFKKTTCLFLINYNVENGFSK